jgi:predicted TIM-barrel fold metal-dependent hydrolase
MRDGFAIFDAHTHIGRALHSGRRCSAEDLLRSMDSFGVDRSLAIPFPVVEDWREANEEVARAARKYPDRLTGAASLDPFLPENELRTQLRRCVEELNLRALKIQPQYQPLDPLSGRAEAIFGAACEMRLPVVCHTGSGVPFALPSLYMMPARRFPELALVLAHSGGGIFVQEAIVAASFCPNIYLELSSLMPHQIMTVLSQIPSTRLMIGSDLPECLETEMGKVLRLDIPDGDRANILWKTCSKVLG